MSQAGQYNSWHRGTILALSFAFTGVAIAEDRLPRRPGTILYKLRADATPDQLDAVENVLGIVQPTARAHGVVAGQGEVVFQMAQVDRRLRIRDEEAVCAELIATGAVEFAEPDYLVPPADTMPNDPHFNLQWHHAKMQSPAAWDLITGDASLIVAILDTGVQSNHPDLAASLRLPGKNTSDNSTDTEPIHFHGTHVAGCVAAIGNNGVGLTGVAWDAEILPVKITNRSDGVAYISDMAEGIMWATDQGAKVLNLSYGGFQYGTIESAASYARNHGALLFMAAGNDNQNLNGYPDSPTFILVGATTSADVRASFSNYGTPVDIVAPGASIYSTYLNSQYASASGTSMASPVAAGVAALMWSANPDLTPAELESLLFDSCDDLGAAGDDSTYGRGRVNAYQAVVAALSGAPPIAHDQVVAARAGELFEETLQVTNNNGDPLTYSIVTNGEHGTAAITNPATGDYSYTAAADTVGNVDQFTFVAATELQQSNVGTVTVAIVGEDGIIPVPDSTLASATVQFYWEPIAFATEYAISAGSSQGASNFFSQNTGENIFATVTGLPTNGSTVHVRVAGRVGGVWQNHDYTYTAHDVAARMTSPMPGSTFASNEVTFSWTAGIGAGEYWLRVGTTPGGRELFDASTGQNRTHTVSGLPYDGSTIYVRLYTRIGSAWPYADYTYTAVTDENDGMAVITSPADGAVLDSASATFAWTEGIGVDEYWLRVGSSAGALDIYNASQGTSMSRSFTTLPTDGRTLYVRLYSRRGSDWPYLDFTYTAHTAEGGGDGGGGDDGGDDPYPELARLTSPAPGSTLSASEVSFAWAAGEGADEYWLRIGSTAGGYDVYDSSTASSLTRLVQNIPTDGRTLHVRLYSRHGSTWPYRDYTLTAFTSGGGGGGGDESEIAELTSPASGATLSAASATFQWSAGTDAGEYWLRLGSTQGGRDILDRTAGTSLSQTVSGLPTDGRTIHVKLYTRRGSLWFDNEYTVTAYTGEGGGDDGSDEDTSIAQLTAPSPGATLTGTSAAFAWSAGTSVNEYWLRIGSADGGRDIYDASAGTARSVTVSTLPADGRTLYVKLYSRRGSNWPFNEYTLTAHTDGGGGGDDGDEDTTIARLTSPAPSSTLGATSATFAWSAGTSVSEYWLRIGSTEGGNDVYDASTGTSVSQTVSGLPGDGRTLHVKLYSRRGSTWPYNSYVLTAHSGGGGGGDDGDEDATLARLTSPSPGSTLSGSSATFVWTAGADVIQYWLRIGSTPGGSDIFDSSNGTSLSRVVSGLPTDGRTLYVKLYSRRGTAWPYNEYTLTASGGGGGGGGDEDTSIARLTSPAPGGALASGTVTLQWTAGVSVDDYWLRIGSSLNGRNYFDGDVGSVTSYTVSGLPTDGSTIYIRLYSRRGYLYPYNDYTVTAAGP